MTITQNSLKKNHYYLHEVFDRTWDVLSHLYGEDDLKKMGFKQDFDWCQPHSKKFKKKFRDIQPGSPLYIRVQFCEEWVLEVREDEERYRLRFEVPGLGKDDVRVTVEDGALVIRGEKRVEDEHGGDGEWWSTSSYGCYHASLLLPEDARVDGIAAEVKDGVLYVTVPRVPGSQRSVTEVKVQ
ncbi:unnamed protein product [Triticum turgidum subsp. durum]|uniref:SHSP domain-containing protein n=1 Tax=Triticum turgidum subsp. durum TaxID=4567 RepID=A0A9R0XYN7_TRITD|nr:unnamed protein product [Triticum turgidum subsp. durum]